MTVGYSGTPLARKLGVKDGYRVGIVGDPHHLGALVDPLPPGVKLVKNPRAPCPVLIAFAPTERRFLQVFPRLVRRLPADGALWIAWPKKSSPRHVDLTEDTIRDLALPLGLVDNKVCAVDEDWSALRLVVRKENRGEWDSSRQLT